MAYTQEEIQAVWDKCGGRCVYGEGKRVAVTNYGKTWTIDHATPDSRGGVDDLRNQLVACKKHNSQKGDNTREEFERWLARNPGENACGS